MLKHIVVVTCVFALSFCLQLYLESRHLVDSLGFWYTVYCSIFYTVIIAGLILIMMRLFRSRIRTSRDSNQ